MITEVGNYRLPKAPSFAVERIEHQNTGLSRRIPISLLTSVTSWTRGFARHDSPFGVGGLAVTLDRCRARISEFQPPSWLCKLVSRLGASRWL